MEIKKVGVLGCGLMGSGIAQVCAMAGFDVTVLEVEQKYLDKGFAGIEKSLAKFAERPIEKGGITAEQKDAARARLRGTTSKSDLSDCDIIIEAIIENVEEKKKMYASVDGVVKKDAIFASNTSSISVTELLTSVKRPERFIGLHFFNPVPLMKLVEVVRTIATADDVYESAYAFAKKLGAPLAIVDKRRVDLDVTEVMNLIGDVKGRSTLIVDDIIDTAGTLVKTADALIREGATQVFAACTHAVFSGRAVERIENSRITEVVATDSVPVSEAARNLKKVTILSVADLLARGIRSIHEETSISELFI